MSYIAPEPTGGPAWVDSRGFQRFLEILPGTLMWLTLLLPILLSWWAPLAVAVFIIAFDLYWMTKSFRLNYNLIRAYRRMHQAQKVNWRRRLEEIKDLPAALAHARSKADSHEVQRIEGLLERQDDILDPRSIYHAVIMATYNESRDILEPSIKSLTEVDYPLDRMIFILAYEERGGEEVERTAHALVNEYGGKFGIALAIKHPDGLPGEIRGKGGNISFAGRALTAEIARHGIKPEQVVVTTFDSDHRASKEYFSYLTYEYIIDSNRKYKSYQPIPMFYNNIWDVPAAMRIIATGNSFWTLMEMMRPHRLRNFAAHAQPLAALIDTDYWSTRTIVEDGHQYWRTYFRYDGRHDVVPLFTPVYQDAVLADTYLKTFRVQFLQLRRWAWGITDFAYAVRHSIANTRIPWSKKLPQLFRLFEGHYSWATASLILMFVAWLPLYLNPQFSYQSLAHNLPVITSRILTVGSLTLVLTMFISIITLPPRPKRYGRVRLISMLAQWLLLPATSIVFSAFAAINAQTRLMLGRYLEFYVTDKATKK